MDNKVSLKRRFLSLPTLVSFVIAIIILLVLATNFDIDWEITVDNILSSNPLFYASALLSYYLGFLLRGLRWQIMLKNSQSSSDAIASVPSFLDCSRYIFLGWFINAITWFRLGDAYRAYLFTEDTGYSFPRAIGTILAERILDVIMIFILLVLASITFYGSANAGGASLFLGIGLILVLIGLSTILMMKKFGTSIGNLLPSKLRNPYTRFQQGAMNSFGHVPFLLIISLLIWFTEVGRLFFAIQALGMSDAITISLILFVTLANAILTTVPITPGGLGIVESGITGLLTLSLTHSEAISVTLLDRSISYLSIVILGGISFLIDQFNRQRRNTAHINKDLQNTPN